MTRTPRTQATAIVFALLVLSPSLPLAAATHTGGTLPDLPVLPHARPTDQCLPLAASAVVLAAAGALQRGDTAYFAQDKGVPVLCGPDGQALQPYRDLILEADRILDQFRNLSREIERQADQRVENAAPERFPPTVTLLDDRFDGRRLGGFGSWTGITSDGTGSGFQPGVVETTQGSFDAYRFGDDEGYKRGVREFLVSPEIDLTAVRGSADSYYRLTAARESAKYALRHLCYGLYYERAYPLDALQGFRPLGGSPAGTTQSPLCSGLSTGMGGPSLVDTLMLAYESALDGIADAAPAGRPVAQLELSYLHNFADTLDGARVWLFVGTRAPDRTALYDGQFTRGEVRWDCRDVSRRTGDATDVGTDSTLDQVDPQGLRCSSSYDAGTAFLLPLQTSRTTAAFDVHDPGSSSWAATGHTPQMVTQRFDLSPWAGQRAWLVVEVATTPDLNRGGTYFDRANFPQEQEEYGFSLAQVRAWGDAYPRNFRLKGFSEPSHLVPAHELLPAEHPATRVVVPPGRDPVVVQLHNAGAYVENGTLTVTFKDAANATLETLDFPVLRIRPSEVRSVAVPWPGPLEEGAVRHVEAKLSVNETVAPDLAQPANSTDPSRSNARVPNAAGAGLGGRVDAWTRVRAFHELDLELRRAVGTGHPLDLCEERPTPQDPACAPAFADVRGKARYLQTSLLNNGSRPEDVQARLLVTRDGKEVPGAVMDEPLRELLDLRPGEARMLTWSLGLHEPGIYQATVVVAPRGDPDVAAAVARRAFYVQRTTGLVCFDNLADARACAPGFTTTQVPGHEASAFTAATRDAAGRLVVATNVTDRGGALLVRGDDGAFARLADISNHSLWARFGGSAPVNGTGTLRSLVTAPDGAIYGVGDNGTALRLAPDGKLQLLPINATGLREARLRAAVWFGGTLWAAGDHGVAFELRADPNGTLLLEPHAVAWTRVREGLPDETVPFQGAFHAAATYRGRAYLAGDGGFVFENEGHGWNLTFNDDKTSCDGSAACNRTIRDLAVAGDRLVAAGDAGLALVKNGSGSFRVVGKPPAAAGVLDFTQVVPAHLGEVFFLTPTLVASCGTCRDLAQPTWSFPVLALPYTLDAAGAPRHARLLASVTSGDATVVLGEDGLLLTYDGGSRFGNTGDWSTLPPLLATRGGFLQTDLSAKGAGAFRGVPAAGTGSGSSTELRVTLVHHVQKADPANPALVRVFFSQMPGPATSTGNALTQPCPASCDENTTRAGFPVYFTRRYLQPTDAAGWQTDRFHVTIPPNSGGFAALEFYKEGDVAWAIDEALVERRVGPDAWEPMLSYYGPHAEPCARTTHCNRGTWRVADAIPPEVYERTGVSLSRPLAPPPADRSTVVSQFLVGGDVDEVLLQDVASAWHLSRSVADRPVWVANDELTHQAGALTHLRRGWNTRLLTPVIDLSEAYDPLASFRHLYAFRTKVDSGVSIGDGGFLEVQYLRRGAECGAHADANTTCWSPFYKVRPEGGYPNRHDVQLGGFSTFILPTSSNHPAKIGPNLAAPDQEGLSFWGRIALPDARGVITDVRDTSRYQEVRVPLTQDAQPTLPVNLSGRQIRVAFRLVTDHSLTDDFTFDHKNNLDSPRSFVGEGWYITDFKVPGARVLGIDLRASALRFDVGYDAARIGVGPGTTVPVNVTVENRGRFDALGYTGTLEVRRVVDAVLGRTELVDVVALPQQPVLEPGARLNHTLRWNVPDVEGAQYVLRLQLDPVGVDRDEDWTDNVVALGSLASPIEARTVKDFDVRFAVTPENATAEITRYVPVFLHNKGNVPLNHLLVTREITLLNGLLAEKVDVRTWRVTKAVPPGTIVALAAVSEDVDPVRDLFWRAQKRATYAITVDAEAVHDGLRRSHDRLTSAFATYLFDDVDAGVAGEAVSGNWSLEGAWSSDAPGFLSSRSHGFGNKTLGRYDALANDSAVMPLVDISAARSARLAFYHRFAFEQGFDGGIVEASVDGGATWRALTPVASAIHALPYGYSNDTIVASSFLHPDGDPNRDQRAFTGDSRLLPEALDGWVLSQFDLTDYPGVTVEGVAYDLFRPALDFEDFEVLEINGRQTLSDPSWVLGSTEDWRYWEVQNTTEGRVRSPTGDGGFWWSGSASIADDGDRPLRNPFLEIPIDLAGVAQDEVVQIEWWEWVDRTGKRGVWVDPRIQSTPSWPDFKGAYTFTNEAYGHTWRFNLTQPEVVARDGMWLRMVATLNDSFKGGRFNVTFGYTPWSSYAAPTANNIHNDFRDDLGFAVDGFAVKAFRVINGQPTSPRVLLNETDAWQRARAVACSVAMSGTSTPIACYRNNLQLEGYSAYEAKGAVGKQWSVVEELRPLPVTWHVVRVMDDPRGASTRPTGEPVAAWYTGDIRCGGANTCHTKDPVAACQAERCVRPLSQSRLVTPAVDLAKVAGASAELTFWHRYAFFQHAVDGSQPIASGGWVEIQAYDEQTGSWSGWAPLFGDGRYGGYTGYTVDTARTGTGKTVRYDPPLPDAPGQEGVHYLFTGTSQWQKSRFDVSPYIGKTVRFAFHSFFSGHARFEQTSCIDVVNTNLATTCKAGWWIGDVAVEGKVLAGKPVLLRLRAATDQSVHDGYWHADDVSVFGSRYDRNVAVFVDGAADYGAVPGVTTTIPVTIRNLGSTVRRGIALEALVADGGTAVVFNGTAPGGAGYDGRDPRIFRFPGYNLAPGASVTVLLDVTPSGPIAGPALTNIVLRLREHNPSAADPYEPIVDNEVQGFLEAMVPFRLARTGDHAFGKPATAPAAPEAGEPVRMSVEARNSGYAVLRLNLTCQAALLDGHAKTNHREDVADRALEKGAVACRLVEGGTRLAPGERTTLVFEAIPASPGVLELHVNGTRWDGIQEVEVAVETVTAFVGVDPVVLQDDFTSPDSRRDWTRSGLPSLGAPPHWSTIRGHRGAGALVLGLNESAPGSATSYTAACSSSGGARGGGSTVCVAQSPPVDLHNFTTGAYLSFWHMDRFARHDGADVKVQILLDETRPNVESSWSPGISSPREGCRIEPVGGYEGPIRSRVDTDNNDQETFNDTNPVYDYPPRNRGYDPSPLRYFVADGGVWEEEWSVSRFDLRGVTCPVRLADGTTVDMPLLGKTVRFVFSLYVGANGMAPMSARGPGHGWLLDDITVSPYSLVATPETQTAFLLDNTTKTFHVAIRNDGHYPDLVRVRYDAGASSAPADAVVAPEEALLVPAGGTVHVPVTLQLPRDPSLLPTRYVASVVAQSLLDPNAEDVSRLEIAFAPRKWPDLSLHVTLPPTVAQEGTESYVPIRVENTGLVRSVATTLRIVDEFPGRAPVVYTLDVPELASYYADAEGSAQVLELRWRPEKGTVGTHTLRFEADPLRLSEEYSRRDNVVVLRAPVSEVLIPDLSLASAEALSLRDAQGAPLAPTRDADVSVYEVAAGELVALHVKLRNTGAAGATNVDVRAFLGPLSLPGKTVPYVAPGGEVSLAFNWVAQKGDYPIRIVARSEQIEVRLDNNEYPVKGVSRLVVKDYEVRGVIEPVEGLVEPGTEIPLALTLSNPGQAGEEIVLQAELPAGWTARFARETIFLRAGETIETAVTIEVPFDAVAGEQLINILLVSRETPMKVAASRTTVDVRATHGGRILPAAVSGAPPALLVPVRLVNDGNSLDPWTLNLRLPPGWTAAAQLPMRVVVPAHGEATLDLRVHVPADAPPGLRALAVSATLPDGGVIEEIVSVDVRPLRAAVARLDETSARPASGAVEYPVVVENAGNVRAPFHVVLVDLPADVAATVEPARFELAPGERAEARLRVTPIERASGPLTLTAYALFDGVHPDTPEGRANFQALRFDLARPDLRVGALETTPRAGIRAGDSVVVKVAVHNAGEGHVTDLAVDLYADDVFVAQAILPAVAPGATEAVFLTWTAAPGEHVLTAVLDPYRDTVDASRDDDAASILVDVSSASPVGGLAAGRAATPGLGLVGLLAALGAALAVTTISRRSGRPPR